MNKRPAMARFAARRPIAILALGFWLIFLATSSGGFENGDTVIRMETARSWLAGNGGALRPELEGDGGVAAPDGRVFSYYGPLQSILMTPFLTVAGLAPIPKDRLALIEPLLISLSLFPALSALALALLARALIEFGFPQRQALLATVGFGLGGIFWHYARMGQEEHLIALGIAVWLLGMARLPRAGNHWGEPMMAVGIVLMMATRWASFPVAAGLGIVGLLQTLRLHGVRARLASRSVAALLLISGAAALLTFNWARFGGPFETGYGLVYKELGLPLFSVDRWHTNALALIASPYRGLLLFSPLVAVGIWGALRGRWPAQATILRPASLVILGIALAFVAAFQFWTAGHGWGPRLLVGVSVLLAAGLAASIWKRPRLELALPVLVVAQLFSTMLPASTEEYVRFLRNHEQPGSCTVWTWECSPFPSRFVRGAGAVWNTLRNEPGLAIRGHAVVPADVALESSDYRTLNWWPVRIAFRMGLYDPRLGLLLSVSLLGTGLFLVRRVLRKAAESDDSGKPPEAGTRPTQGAVA